MKIEQVEIVKFRSIKYAKINMHDITAIVGENNAGKTAILRALNAVMNYDQEMPYFIANRHQYTPKCNTKITLSFIDIPTEFADKVFNNRLTIEFSYVYSTHKESYKIVRGRDSSEKVDDQFMKSLANHIRYVYIPSDRTNKDVLWGDDSIFKLLVSGYVAQHTENRDTISTPVRQATGRIHELALKKLERSINGLYMQNRDMDFQIDFPNDLDYSVLLEKVSFSLNAYGRCLPLEEWGSGTRSLAIIAMHRALALLHNSSIILGIEEPEVNLHPQAQKKFIMSLKDNRHKNETQSIFSTHSTVLVDSLRHEEIVLVRRTPDPRGFVSEVTQISDDFWKRNGIEEFGHYQFFNYRNSDFFFSKYVVVGESKNDCQIFKHLIDPLISNYSADISFLDIGGTSNLCYPFFLLKELGIPFTIVVDKDYLFDYKYYVVGGKPTIARDKNGLPQYVKTLSLSPVVKDMFKTQQSRDRVEQANLKGYRALFDVIKEKNLLCMNYNLEVDLTCSRKARDKYYIQKRIPAAEQSQFTLLTKYSKSIKSMDSLYPIIVALPNNALPESYKKIKNHIASQIIMHLTQTGKSFQ